MGRLLPLLRPLPLFPSLLLGRLLPRFLLFLSLQSDLSGRLLRLFPSLLSGRLLPLGRLLRRLPLFRLPLLGRLDLYLP